MSNKLLIQAIEFAAIGIRHFGFRFFSSRGLNDYDNPWRIYKEGEYAARTVEHTFTDLYVTALRYYICTQYLSGFCRGARIGNPLTDYEKVKNLLNLRETTSIKIIFRSNI